MLMPASGSTPVFLVFQGSANPNSGKQYYWVKITGERIVGVCDRRH